MPTYFRTYGDGELLDSEDLDQDNNAVRDLIGAAVQVILSANNGNALPSEQPTPGGPYPLLVVPGTGLQILVGGNNQSVLVGGRVARDIPQVAFSVPPNTSGSTRVDALCIAFANPTTNPQTRPIENPDTTINPSGTVYSVLEGLSFQYLAGNTTPPAGYYVFAEISVPNGASSITTGEITIMFPTVASLLADIVGGLASLNGETGAVSVTAGSGIAVTLPSAHLIQILNTGLLSLNGITGAAAIAGGAAIGISLSGSDVVITNLGVTSIGAGSALTGDVSVVAGAGIGVHNNPGNQIEIDNTGVRSLNGQTGDANITGGTGIGVSVPGSDNIQITNTGVTQMMGQTGNITSYIGMFLKRTVRINAGSPAGQVLQLDAPLPAGNWRVFATATADVVSSTMTITGSDGATSWESPGHSTCQDGNGTEIVQLQGTAVGGNQPAVTMSYGAGSPFSGSDYVGCITLECWRVS